MADDPALHDWKPLVEDLTTRREKAYGMGGPDRIERQLLEVMDVGRPATPFDLLLALAPDGAGGWRDGFAHGSSHSAGHGSDVAARCRITGPGSRFDALR